MSASSEFFTRAEREAAVVFPPDKQIMLRGLLEDVIRSHGYVLPDANRPLGATEVARALLQRATAQTEHSSVTLKTNAKGDTQIEVTVRTGESEDVATAADAAAKAKAVYDTLRGFYPMSTPDA